MKAIHWTRLEGKELEDRILDLAQRGRILEATALAKQKFNMSPTEAVNFVDELLAKPSNL